MTANILKELKETLPEGLFNMIAQSLPDKMPESKVKEFAKRIAEE